MHPSRRATGGGTPGPAEIAEALERHGHFITRLPRVPEQQLVDLHWSAHQAGRLLGIKVRVAVEEVGFRSYLIFEVTPRHHGRQRRVPTGHRARH
jgi:hypothetical protein